MGPIGDGVLVVCAVVGGVVAVVDVDVDVCVCVVGEALIVSVDKGAIVCASEMLGASVAEALSVGVLTREGMAGEELAEAGALSTSSSSCK